MDWFFTWYTDSSSGSIFSVSWNQVRHFAISTDFFVYVGLNFFVESFIPLKPISEGKVKRNKLISNIVFGIVAALFIGWIFLY